MEKGIYLQMRRETMGEGSDKKAFEVHSVAQIFEPAENGRIYDKPRVWEVWLQPNVFKPAAVGTLVNFDYGVKKDRKTGAEKPCIKNLRLASAK